MQSQRQSRYPPGSLTSRAAWPGSASILRRSR
jgi:hypothetical protein